ncbi:hypothetical protein FFR93_00950 [Rhizobium sp. MHM7A]|nr:hypothetical protein FFR93_00950 [Rhizobium sp. MHM7A]
MIIDEIAVTAMFVHETINRMLEMQSADHPIHAWRKKLSGVETRYQSIGMAVQIDAVWNSLAESEIDAILFEEVFVPKMLEQMDFSVADLENSPKFKYGGKGAQEYTRQHLLTARNG